MTITTIAALFYYLVLGEEKKSYARLLSTASCLSTPSLVLQQNRFGIRGVFLGKTIKEVYEGHLLLAVPLSSCVKNLSTKKSNGDDDSSFWLAKEFLEFDNKNLLDAWSELLPSPIDLRESLPLHWQDVALQATSLQSFQLQAKINRDIQKSRVKRLQKHCNNSILQIQPTHLSLDDVLDLCNTRMCQVESEDLKGNIIAPAFDMINHASHGYNNASYGIERFGNEYFLVVRSKREFEANEEILIDYGECTRDLDCVHNYGFVPRDIEAGAEITFGEKVHVLNLRRTKYGIGADLAKVASHAVENKAGDSEAEWIIGRLDEMITKTNIDFEGQDVDTRVGIVGLESALNIRRVSHKLMLICRDRLLSEHIRNPLRKLRLSLSRPRMV